MCRSTCHTIMQLHSLIYPVLQLMFPFTSWSRVRVYVNACYLLVFLCEAYGWKLVYIIINGLVHVLCRDWNKKNSFIQNVLWPMWFWIHNVHLPYYFYIRKTYENFSYCQYNIQYHFHMTILNIFIFNRGQSFFFYEWSLKFCTDDWMRTSTWQVILKEIRK